MVRDYGNEPYGTGRHGFVWTSIAAQIYVGGLTRRRQRLRHRASRRQTVTSTTTTEEVQLQLQLQKSFPNDENMFLPLLTP